MAVGKNKKLGKKKKAQGRKAVDPFAKKEWYDVKVPSVFPIRQLGHTVVTKTSGQKLARDSLVNRVFEASLGDLKENSEDNAFRKFRFKVEDVNGNQCLTSFYGMELTTDKLRSLVRKWHSLIEAHADVRTTDGFALRLFCIGFTKRRPNQARKTSYAQSSQVRAIRKKMIEVMQQEASSVELSQLVEKKKGSEEGSFRLVKAQVSAQTYVKMGFAVEKKLLDREGEVDWSVFPAWKTKPEKAIMHFEVLARVEDNGRVVPERIAEIQPFEIQESIIDSFQTGNTSMSKAQIVHPPPMYFTL